MNDDRRRYRKIFIRLWKNPEFRRLPEGEKLLTLYLLSGPQTNRIGIYQVSFALAMEDLDWKLPTLKHRLGKSCQAFRWSFDAHSNVIWIPSWWDFNSPTENPKNMQGALSDVYELPSTPLIYQFAKHLTFVPKALHGLFQGVAEWYQQRSPMGQCSNGDRTQEQEQEQEKEQEQEDSSAALARTEPAVLTFPTVGLKGTSWALTDTQVSEWQTAFPSIDILAEARKARVWVHANPGRKKTADGMPRFLVSWFNRATNSSRPSGSGRPSHLSKKSEDIAQSSDDFLGHDKY